MVQQMTDSKFSGYGMPNTGPGLANQDKQPTLLVTAKKTALRDVHNEIRVSVPQSGSTSFPKESGPMIEASKACGTKRPAPECLGCLPQFQSPTSSAANGHLVYVRRRPDIELAKSSISDNTGNNSYCPQEERKLGGYDEITEQKSHMKEPKVSVPEVAPISRASLLGFSSGNPSVSPSLGKSCNILQPDSNHPPLSPAIPPLDSPKKVHYQRWEERYCQLQDLLKMLDHSNQEDYVQMLRSLSSVELSRHAVELEKRSIQLSLGEVKELQRVEILDVLGKYSKISRAPLAQEGQLEN